MALLIGVEHYRDPRIAPLQFAAADAIALAERLRDRCAFDRTVVLTDHGGDAEPDLVNITNALSDLAGELREEDLFLFFFSGHGIEVDGHGYLLTRDSPFAFPEHCSLSLELLRKTLARLAAGKRVLLMDACRNSPEASKGDSGNPMADAVSKDIVAAARSKLAAGVTTALLSACRPGQRAYEWPSKRHGAFTHFLLEGLDGPAWSGSELEFKRLAGYAFDRVRGWAQNTPGLSGSQEPWYEEFGDPKPILLSSGTAMLQRTRPPKAMNGAAPGRCGRVDVIEEPALRIESVPSAAAVSVDGRRVGTAPLKLTLPAGRYRIRAELDGYETWERLIRFDAAGDAALPITLSISATSIPSCKRSVYRDSCASGVQNDGRLTPEQRRVCERLLAQQELLLDESEAILERYPHFRETEPNGPAEMCRAWQRMCQLCSQGGALSGECVSILKKAGVSLDEWGNHCRRTEPSAGSNYLLSDYIRYAREATYRLRARVEAAMER